MIKQIKQTTVKRFVIERFWMIYVQGGHSPEVIHTEFKKAHEEAIRMCQNESKPVWVLESIRQYWTEKPKVKWESTPKI